MFMKAFFPRIVYITPCLVGHADVCVSYGGVGLRKCYFSPGRKEKYKMERKHEEELVHAGTPWSIRFDSIRFVLPLDDRHGDYRQDKQQLPQPLKRCIAKSGFGSSLLAPSSSGNGTETGRDWGLCVILTLPAAFFSLVVQQ